VQAVQRGLAELGGPGGAATAADALRLVDNYIKAGLHGTPRVCSLCVDWQASHSTMHTCKLGIFWASAGMHDAGRTSPSGEEPYVQQYSQS
jgi:hypothetical protein